jgi:TonB family protein
MFKLLFITIFVLVAGNAVEVRSQVMPCHVDNNTNSVSVRAFDNPDDSPQILEKPQVVFPPSLRYKLIVGTISLKVTFLASGKIGKISVVKGLEKDLDAAAVKAARKIRFVPAKKNGRRVTVIKVMDYDFYDRRKCLPMDKQKN